MLTSPRFTGAFALLLVLSNFSASARSGVPSGEHAARVAAVSAQYIGKPYQLGPMGEGPDGDISTKPLWNEELFDCTTYVETVLAQALARDEADRECVMRHLRYVDGEVSFLNRLHLPDAEWAPQQRVNGVLVDVTERIGGPEETQIVTATLSRAAWLKSLKLSAVQKDAPPAEKAKLLAELKRQGEVYPPVEVSVAYVPLTSLLRDADLVARVPTGTVFNVVRRGPDWIVRGKRVHVETMISHQGFIVRKGAHTFVRSATMLGAGAAAGGGRRGGVADMKLESYLKYLRGIVDPKTGEENVVGLNFLLPQPRPAGLCPAGR